MAESSVGGKKLVRSKSGLRIVAHTDNGKSPFELQEPIWIPDVETPGCMQCQAKFDFVKRRHHCRRCGRIYCGNCCETKLPLTRMCFVDPVRVCEPCADVTKKENDFFERHLKVLIDGGSFAVSSSCNDSLEKFLPFFIKLSSDQRYLTFNGGDYYKHENVEIYDVSYLQIEKIPDEYSGGTSSSATSINLKFKDANYMDQKMKLTAATVPNKKQSVAWIVALQKALKMVYESKVATTPP